MELLHLIGQAHSSIDTNSSMNDINKAYKESYKLTQMVINIPKELESFDNIFFFKKG